jgi:hypothetical protein
MKEFDWSTCSFKGARLLWLRENFNKKVSLEKFLEMMDATRDSAGHNSRSPSYARRSYKNLTEVFGFFQ